MLAMAEPMAEPMARTGETAAGDDGATSAVSAAQGRLTQAQQAYSAAKDAHAAATAALAEWKAKEAQAASAALQCEEAAGDAVLSGETLEAAGARIAAARAALAAAERGLKHAQEGERRCYALAEIAWAAQAQAESAHFEAQGAAQYERISGFVAEVQRTGGVLVRVRLDAAQPDLGLINQATMREAEARRILGRLEKQGQMWQKTH